MSDITLKIHQGTGRLTGESLCRSCVSGRIFKDYTGEHITCIAAYMKPMTVRGAVFSCNSYYSQSLPSISAMEETAWTLRTEKGGKMIGFTPPEPNKNKAPR